MQTMLLADFLAIGIVGAVLSIAIQGIKAKLKLNGAGARLITIGLSCLVGAVYYFLRDTVIWVNVIGVLTSASTVYALLLKK